jgi:hypothetical protein
MRTIQKQPKSSPTSRLDAGGISMGTVAVPVLCRTTGDVSWSPRLPVRLGQRDLLSFVNITSPREAGRLAAKWGPLRICRAHDLPGSHRLLLDTPGAALRAAASSSPSYCPPIVRRGTRNSVLAMLEDVAADWNAAPSPPKGKVAAHIEVNLRRYGEEPLERWVYYASRFRQVLPARELRRRMEPRDLDSVRLLLREWLLLGGVGLSAVVVGHDLQPVIVSGGLFGSLAALLFATICGGKMTLCSSCATPFIAKRAPQAGRNSYCSKCGRPASSLAATRRYDAKNPGRSHHASR